MSAFLDHQPPQVSHRPRFQNDDAPYRLTYQASVCRGFPGSWNGPHSSRRGSGRIPLFLVRPHQPWVYQGFEAVGWAPRHSFQTLIDSGFVRSHEDYFGYLSVEVIVTNAVWQRWAHEVPCIAFQVSAIAPVPIIATRRHLWLSRLEGHLKTQGYEHADGDSIKPLMCIHLGRSWLETHAIWEHWGVVFLGPSVF